jgi:DNA-binding MarR family transcriptional regulator
MAAATALMRVQQLLLARFDAIAAGHGLTFARYEALVLLAFSREQELSMSKIGQRLMVHPTSATNIVQRLAALARITPAGLAAMEAVTAELEAVDFGLESLADEQVDGLSELLRHIRSGAGDFTS